MDGHNNIEACMCVYRDLNFDVIFYHVILSPAWHQPKSRDRHELCQKKGLVEHESFHGNVVLKRLQGFIVWLVEAMSRRPFGSILSTPLL